MSGEVIWFPTLEEYNPDISKEKWLEILDDRNLTTEQNLHILACMYDFGGEATCTQLAEKYGGTKNTYNSGFSKYAERLVKAKVCVEPTLRDNGKNQWWPVVFTGHDADKDIPGSYVWKLRDELKEACAEYGIENWLKTEGNANMSEIEKYAELLKENKNIILHGAPGTGKTYLAKQIAEAMGCSKDEIGFCQFHPSYDYTDFVEGLRPMKNNGFERKDGVFKEFCADAIENIKDSQRSETEIKEVYEFKERYELMLEKIENGEVTEFITKTGTKMLIEDVSDGNNLHLKPDGSIRVKPYIISLPRLERLALKFSTKKALLNIKAVNKEFRNVIGGCNSTGYWAVMNWIYENTNVTTDESILAKSVKVQKKNYVFIIDEINRGELSKIFGELFFSIDPGYRGRAGKVSTQYQNLVDEDDVFADGFYIPENVYIIGTMNDIDRSVESMDFAMRRRFTFVEVTAEESAANMGITGEALEKMNAVNKVISKMPELGRSYCIGAAYFKDAEDLQKLWDFKISSLVYEYLRGIDNYTDEHKNGEKFDEIKSAYDHPESVK